MERISLNQSGFINIRRDFYRIISERDSASLVEAELTVVTLLLDGVVRNQD